MTQERPILATYLHLSGREAFRPSTLNDTGLLLMRSHEPLVSFYRFLYDAVGRDFWWVDRLKWPDARLGKHLARPDVHLLVLYARGTPAGYAELDFASTEPGVELQYFGIIPEFQGRGLGKHLLSNAIEYAFDHGAERIWLSTRSTDGPRAIANYEARGFVPYRTEWEPAPVHPSGKRWG